MSEIIKQDHYPDILRNIIRSIQGIASGDEHNQEIPTTLEQRALQRTHNEAILHQRNIEDVLKGAAEHLALATPSNANPIDQDWLRIVMNDVKDISNEEMKRIWSKMLAGEILRPKTYSLRSIQVLRTLSKEDAVIISNVAPFLLSDDQGKRMIIHQRNHDSQMLSFDDLLFLNELGLLETSVGIGMSWMFDKEESDYSNCIKLHNGNVGVNLYFKQKEFTLPAYTATVIGNQIFSLIEDVKPNTAYYEETFCGMGHIGKCVCGIISRETDNCGYVFSDEIFSFVHGSDKDCSITD